MLKEEFTRKDGSKGNNFKPQEKDFIVSKMSKAWKSDLITIQKDGETREFYNYGIRAEHNNEIIFVKLSKAQYDNLDSELDLKDKTIEFYAYENDYGTQLGCKVVKL